MCEERQKTSKAGIRRSTSGRNPANRTWPSRPSSWARARSQLSSSPWPTITNRTSGTRAITCAAAMRRVAWSLCPVSAATLPTTGAPAGTPSARSASSPPAVGARSGTPSYTTRTWAADRPPSSSTRATARLTAMTRRHRRYFQRERAPRSANPTRREATSRAAEDAISSGAGGSLAELGQFHVRVVRVERGDREPGLAQQDTAAHDVVAEEGPRGGEGRIKGPAAPAFLRRLLRPQRGVAVDGGEVVADVVVAEVLHARAQAADAAVHAHRLVDEVALPAPAPPVEETELGVGPPVRSPDPAPEVEGEAGDAISGVREAAGGAGAGLLPPA